MLFLLKLSVTNVARFKKLMWKNRYRSCNCLMDSSTFRAKSNVLCWIVCLSMYCGASLRGVAARMKVGPACYPRTPGIPACWLKLLCVCGGEGGWRVDQICQHQWIFICRELWNWWIFDLLNGFCGEFWRIPEGISTVRNDYDCQIGERRRCAALSWKSDVRKCSIVKSSTFWEISTSST